MFVHGGDPVPLNLDSQHTDLIVLELNLVMLGIDLDRIEFAGDHLSCSRLLQLDFKNVERIVGKHFRRMHAVRGAPLYLAFLPIEKHRFSAVLIFKALLAGLKVDHHPVHLMFVELAFNMSFLEGSHHLYLIIFKPGPRARL